jgi:hypothetical protein
MATSAAKHTPGTWAYDETTLSICRLIVSVEDVKAFHVFPKTDEGHAIAYVPCDVDRKEQEANARLITAAPDLLVLAKAIREQFPLAGVGSCKGSDNPLEDLLARAEAAIARAEGTE